MTRGRRGSPASVPGPKARRHDRRSYAAPAALKDGGRVASATNAAGEGPGRRNVVAAASPEILGRVAQHLADGTLTVPIQQTYDLAQAPDALQALGATHTQGKLALRVT